MKNNTEFIEKDIERLQKRRKRLLHIRDRNREEILRNTVNLEAKKEDVSDFIKHLQELSKKGKNAASSLYFFVHNITPKYGVETSSYFLDNFLTNNLIMLEKELQPFTYFMDSYKEVLKENGRAKINL